MSDVPRVSVAVRVRPVLAHGGSSIHQLERFSPLIATRRGDHNIELQEHNIDEACKSSTFVFDHIFDVDATQLEVYEEAVVDLIDSALIGHNATIMAYGQTGSGKTHTVLGDVKPNPLEDDLLTAESGIFLRVLNELLDYKKRREKDVHVVLGLSCVEIYCEQIRDLFGGKSDEPPPPIKATVIDDYVLMKDLTTREVTSMQSVFNEVQLAISRRKSRSTESNQTSSRSHCLFTIDVLQIEKKYTDEPPRLELITTSNEQLARKTGSGGAGGSSSRSSSAQPSGWHGSTMRMPGVSEPVRTSKILIADLAGSEKIDTSGVTGDGLKEAKAINSSLTALGNVVHNLYEGTHVAYRTSSLTCLLKPSFSQKTSKVLLLSQISPTQVTFAESVNTLHFANKVKAMKVVTQLGAESDRIEYEVLEMQKYHAAALADLHIANAESGCPAALFKVGRSQLHSRFLTAPQGVTQSALQKTTSAQHNERARRLEDNGAIEAEGRAKEEYQRQVVEEREREKAMRPQYVREMVGEHQDNRSQLEAQLAEQNRSLMMALQNEAKADRYRLKEEEKSAYASLEVEELRSQRDAMQRFDDRVHAEVERVLAIPMPRSVIADEAQRQDDEAYAISAWAHGTGRRFLNCFLELRDTQHALQIAELNRLQLENWAEKHRPEILQKRDEVASSQKQQEKEATVGVSNSSLSKPSTSTQPQQQTAADQQTRDQPQQRHVDPTAATTSLPPGNSNGNGGASSASTTKKTPSSTRVVVAVNNPSKRRSATSESQ